MADERVRVVLEFEGQDAERNIKKFNKALGETEKQTKKTSLSFNKAMIALTGLNQGLALAGKAVDAAKKAFEFGREGAEIERLERAGDMLASSFGQNMDDIVAALKRGSGNTISELDAMASANRALQLGVSTTPKEFEELSKAAIALGRAMGRGPKESIDDIVTGIGRMSPLILDNLGIMTNGGKVFDKYAKDIGKLTAELTDNEKKQALVNQTMDDAAKLLDENGNLVDDVASAYDRLTVATQDSTDRLKLLVGEALEPTVSALADMIEESNQVNEVMDTFGVKMNGWTGNFEFAGQAIGSTREEVIAWAEAMERSTGQADALMIASGNLAVQVADTRDATADLAEKELLQLAVEALISGNVKLAQHYADLAFQAEQGAERTRDLIAALDELDGKKITAEILILGGQVDAYAASGHRFTSGPQTAAPATATPSTGGGGRGGGLTARSSGGPLGAGWTLVGEQGQELITPGGVVIPATKTRRLLRSGLLPQFKRAVSSGGDVGAGETPPKTDPWYIWGPSPGITYGNVSATGVYNNTTSSGGTITSPATSPADAAPAAAAVAAVEAVEDVAKVTAISTGVSAQQAKAMTESTKAQAMASRRQEGLLAGMLSRLNELPSVDEMRSIMEETENTSGF